MNKMPSNHRILRPGAVLAIALAMAPMSVALAHEGHDHADEDPVAAPPTDTGPRATRQTEDFELVARMDGGTLTLHLDDFATNEPVRGAKVEIDSGAFKAVAGMQAPGVYTTSAPALAKPGRHAMTVSVEAGDKADLLDVTLETPAAGMGEETAGHDHHGGLALGPWAWALAAAALLAVAVVLGLRTRSRSGPGSRASDKAGS